MATLQEYTAVAPTVMSTGDFTVEQVETKLSSVPQVQPADPVPEPTKPAVQSLFNIIFAKSTVKKSIAFAGGYTEISKTTGLSRNQVVTLIGELSAMVSLYKGGQ